MIIYYKVFLKFLRLWLCVINFKQNVFRSCVYMRPYALHLTPPLLTHTQCSLLMKTHLVPPLFLFVKVTSLNKYSSICSAKIVIINIVVNWVFRSLYCHSKLTSFTHKVTFRSGKLMQPIALRQNGRRPTYSIGSTVKYSK